MNVIDKESTGAGAKPASSFDIFAGASVPAEPVIGTSDVSVEDLFDIKNQRNEAKFRFVCLEPFVMDIEPGQDGVRRKAMIHYVDHSSDFFISSRGDAKTGEGFGRPTRGLSVNFVGRFLKTDEKNQPIQKEDGSFEEVDGDVANLATVKPYRTGVRNSGEDSVVLRQGFMGSRFGFPVVKGADRENPGRINERIDWKAEGVAKAMKVAEVVILGWKQLSGGDPKHPLAIIYGNWDGIPTDAGSNSRKQSRGIATKAKTDTKVTGVESLTGINPLKPAPTNEAKTDPSLETV